MASECHKYHQYTVKTCPKCGADFCYACCGDTNVSQGGKHDPNYMYCPHCGWDYYSDPATE